MPPTLPTPSIHNFYHTFFSTYVPPANKHTYSLRISLDAVSDSIILLWGLRVHISNKLQMKLMLVFRPPLSSEVT